MRSDCLLLLGAAEEEKRQKEEQRRQIEAERRRQEEERRRVEQQRRMELQKQQEAAAAAANKKAQEVREKSQQQAQASMAMGQQQAMGAQQKAAMPGQQQPKSYLSQFRNDKEGDGEGSLSQGSSDHQLSQGDRLSQDYEKMAGVDGLDAGLGDDKDKQSQLAFLEASLKMLPDFEHDRCVLMRACFFAGTKNENDTSARCMIHVTRLVASLCFSVLTTVECAPPTFTLQAKSNIRQPADLRQPGHGHALLHFLFPDRYFAAVPGSACS